MSEPDKETLEIVATGQPLHLAHPRHLKHTRKQGAAAGRCQNQAARPRKLFFQSCSILNSALSRSVLIFKHQAL